MSEFFMVIKKYNTNVYIITVFRAKERISAIAECFGCGS